MPDRALYLRLLQKKLQEKKSESEHEQLFLLTLEQTSVSRLMLKSGKQNSH